MMDVRFQCPRCGGSFFGSYRMPDGSLERGCHGQRYKLDTEHLEHGQRYIMSGCDFMWPDADDWKYEVMYLKREAQADPIFDLTRRACINHRLVPQPQPGDSEAIRLLDALTKPEFLDGSMWADGKDGHWTHTYAVFTTDAGRFLRVSSHHISDAPRLHIRFQGGNHSVDDLLKYVTLKPAGTNAVVHDA